MNGISKKSSRNPSTQKENICSPFALKIGFKSAKQSPKQSNKTRNMSDASSSTKPNQKFAKISKNLSKKMFTGKNQINYMTKSKGNRRLRNDRKPSKNYHKYVNSGDVGSHDHNGVSQQYLYQSDMTKYHALCNDSSDT